MIPSRNTVIVGLLITVTVAVGQALTTFDRPAEVN